MNAGYKVSKEKLLKNAKLQHQKAVEKHAGKKCGHCGNTLAYEKRIYTYCSCRCARLANMALGRGGRKPKNYICVQCNGRIHKGSRNREFCCKLCKGANYLGKWMEGGPGGTPIQISKLVREWLIKECENKCSKCGWSEVNESTGKVPLTIDHKDGNSENHVRENLQVLCPNCHSLTSTYGALNRGNGRKYRYKKSNISEISSA